MSQSCPTGNGEIRGPEDAQGAGTPLPGTRPSRAAANNARHRDFLDEVVADQGGFGTEDMVCTPWGMGGTSQPVSDEIAPPPDLYAMGNPGEPFGGM